jgi:hypothetical protein
MMATAQQREQRERREDLEQHRSETRNVLIGEQVLHALGRPSDLLIVQVRPLWDSRYRVNVFVGPDTMSARVVNSFFLQADDDGNIIASTPPIVRQAALVPSA